MAEIIDPTPRYEEPEQILFIDNDIATAASQCKTSADQFFTATQQYQSIPYVKNLRDTVTSVLPAVFPVEVGAPTEPYIDGLLEKRKAMEKVDESVRAGTIPAKNEDEEGANLATDMWQGFSMMFRAVLFYFEEGLSPNQRW